MRQYAPIVLFVYNRVDKVKKVLTSLGDCELAKYSDLYIFSDAAKKYREDVCKVAEVREYVQKREYIDKFRSVTVSLAKEHKGLANSVIEGVTNVIRKHGKVIVVEDDLILAPDFLVYMNQALKYYRNDKWIWSISGFTPQLPRLNEISEDVYFSYRGSSWGWATWINRWKNVDWDVKDFEKFRKNPVKQLLLNRGGYDLTKMLFLQMRGKIDSWAVRWCYAQSRQRRLTVYPKYTLVWNAGMDGSGTHCGRGEKQKIEFKKVYSDISFSKVYMDRMIIKQFRDNYGCGVKEWIMHYIENIF